MTLSFADNQSSSDEIFVSKVAYELLYPTSENFEKSFSTYSNSLYGKQHTTGNLLFVNKSHLEVIDGCLVLDFVKDAVTDFLKSAKLLINAGKTCISTIIPNMTVERGYIDFFSEHSKILKSFQNSFFNYLSNSSLTNDITDFKSFLKHLVLFYIDYSKRVNVSGIAVYKTKYELYTTGLALDVSTHPHDDDTFKFNQFIQNPSYDDYTRLAGEYGFWVNRHAPWNLIANIGSKQMQRYMLKRGITSFTQFFEKKYLDTVYVYDYFNLINFFKSSYVEFVKKFPRLEKKEKCSSSRFFLDRVADTNGVDLSELRDVYIEFKLIEARKLPVRFSVIKQIDMNTKKGTANNQVKIINDTIARQA